MKFNATVYATSDARPVLLATTCIRTIKAAGREPGGHCDECGESRGYFALLWADGGRCEGVFCIKCRDERVAQLMGGQA